MPKSYLADEPGAMRGAYHQFDPYHQTLARIQALENIGRGIRLYPYLKEWAPRDDDLQSLIDDPDLQRLLNQRQ